jgi:tetratricopeptide (TPR) repeat protein
MKNRIMLNKSKLYFRIFSIFFIIFVLRVNLSAQSANICDRYYEAAMEKLRKKNLEQSEQLFSVGISKCPNDIRLYYFRAKLRHHYMRKIILAIGDYSYVIKMNPHYNPKAFWRRGECFYMLGNYLGAIKDYNRCLKLIPEYGRVYMLRAKAFAKIGKKANALQDIDNAVRCDPKYKRRGQELRMRILQGNSDF